MKASEIKNKYNKKEIIVTLTNYIGYEWCYFCEFKNGVCELHTLYVIEPNKENKYYDLNEKVFDVDYNWFYANAKRNITFNTLTK